MPTFPEPSKEIQKLTLGKLLRHRALAQTSDISFHGQFINSRRSINLKMEDIKDIANSVNIENV